MSNSKIIVLKVYKCTSSLLIFRITDLKIDPTNVAIPTSLIYENDQGQLVFTFYVQLSDSFVSKRDLQLAVQVYKSNLKN